MSVIERAPRAAAIGMALTMLGTPAAVEASTVPAQHPPKEVFDTHEQDEKQFRLPLDILEDMIDINSPAISNIYEEVSQDPSAYMELRKEEGYKDFASPGYRYFIYADEHFSGETNVPWSIQIFVGTTNSEPDSATVVVRLNPELEVYQGKGDQIPELAEIPGFSLEEASESIFKIPDAMTQIPWFPDFDTPYPYPDFERVFTDGRSFYFSQTVRPNNLIEFYSLYPIPDMSEVGSQNAPEPLLDNVL